MIDIREKDKAIIIDFANSCFNKDTEVWVFGSRIKGKSHDGSDLDLVIKSTNDKTTISKQIIEFERRLKDSNIPINVQILDWNSISDNFKANILLDYEVLNFC